MTPVSDDPIVVFKFMIPISPVHKLQVNEDIDLGDGCWRLCDFLLANKSTKVCCRLPWYKICFFQVWLVQSPNSLWKKVFLKGQLIDDASLLDWFFQFWQKVMAASHWKVGEGEGPCNFQKRIKRCINTTTVNFWCVLFAVRFSRGFTTLLDQQI